MLANKLLTKTFRGNISTMGKKLHMKLSFSENKTMCLAKRLFGQKKS